MQPWELAKLFENLQHLDLRQHLELAYKDCKASFEELTALRRLKSLKVQWHPSHRNFSVLQVLTIDVSDAMHPNVCSYAVLVICAQGE